MKSQRNLYFFQFGSNEILSKVVRRPNMSLSGNPSNENICSGETDKQRYGGEQVDMPTPKREDLLKMD